MIPPVTVGADQLYVVPDGIMVLGGALAGVIVNVLPLQIVAVCEGTTGVGFTVTVMVKLLPGQGILVVGVTVYVAVCGIFVGFISVPDMEVCPLPAAPPVNPPVTVGADQLYVIPSGTIVPGGLFAGVTVNVPPLQMIADCA